MLTASSLWAQTKVPAEVETAFKQKFVNAINVKWDKEGKNEYEAEFTLNGKKASANFNAKGEWTESEMQIENSTVPAAAVSLVKEKHPAGVITTTYKVEKANGSIEYEIEITVGKKTKELVFDKDWKFIK